MKGVILAAGAGDHLKPLTDLVSKPMIPILDRPLIDYAIERLTKSGIREIYIVVGNNKDEIQTYLNNKQSHILFHLVEQVKPGIDGAILSVKGKFAEDEQFLMTHSDIIVDPDIITRTLNAADNTGSDMAIAVTLQSELQEFGLVNLNSDGLIENVIPSPANQSDGNYIVAGSFLLIGKLFNYLDDNTPFNQSFNKYIQDGGTVAGGIWNNPWIDVGRPWDILRATWFELEKIQDSIISKTAKIEHNVEIKGPVIIEDGAQILNGSVVKGPAYIGKNAFIGNNSLIRESSVIGNEAKIGMGVEVRSSVILSGASIARLSYVGASIIGSNATLHSGAITINSKRPASPIKTSINGQDVEVPLKKFGAIIGPNSHIGEHTSLQPGTRVDTNAIVPPNVAVGGHIKSED